MDHGAEDYRRFLGGSITAMADLIRAYQSGLTLYLNGFTKDLSAAEELAQETFLRLYVKRPRFRGESSFRTWLYAIGRNLALSHLKREQKRRALPQEAAPEIPDTAADPAGLYLADERRRTLHAAMGRLKPEYHQALWLRYFEGMPVREVARVMKKSEKAAGVLLHRARQALKTELEKEGFHDDDL